MERKTMRRLGRIAGTMAIGLLSTAVLALGTQVYVGMESDGRWVTIEEAERIAGTVAYQGPVFDEGDPNWKDEVTYVGVKIADLLAPYGSFDTGDLVSVIAFRWLGRRHL